MTTFNPSVNPRSALTWAGISRLQVSCLLRRHSDLQQELWKFFQQLQDHSVPMTTISRSGDDVSQQGRTQTGSDSQEEEPAVEKLVVWSRSEASSTHTGQCVCHVFTRVHTCSSDFLLQRSGPCHPHGLSAVRCQSEDVQKSLRPAGERQQPAGEPPSRPRHVHGRPPHVCFVSSR